MISKNKKIIIKITLSWCILTSQVLFSIQYNFPNLSFFIELQQISTSCLYTPVIISQVKKKHFLS